MEGKLAKLDITLEVPEIDKIGLSALLREDSNSPFTKVDSNLAAWLSDSEALSSKSEIKAFELAEHMNNHELQEALTSEVPNGLNYFTMEQIHYLANQSLSSETLLQKNGFSNLFFVKSTKDSNTYIVGMVWDATDSKFVPYIYRLHNLYRSWSKGNRVFVNFHNYYA